jgi:hypothetical protein
MRGRASLVVAFALLAPRALVAQTAGPPSQASVDGPPAPPAADAATSSAPDSAARDEAQAAAALRAAQELEARVIELQRQLDAMERERASYQDLRRRVDDLEARQAALHRAPPGDWTSFPGGMEGLRFTPSGPVIHSAGNRFLLRPGMRLQGLYEADLATKGPADAARPDSSAFALTHAELLLEGHAWGPRLEFRFEADFGETLPRIIKDAFVQYRFASFAAVRVGQFKVPFGLQTQYWNANLELVDVAEATAAFSLDRDVGLMLVGRPLAGRLQYHVSMTTGPRGPCPPNLDDLRCDQLDLAYAARVVAAPFGPLPPVEGDLVGQRRPLLSVGVSGAYLLLPTDVRDRTAVPNALLDLDRDGRVDNVGVLQGGADLRAQFRGASLQAEWLGRREHPGVAGADRSYWGAYGQASYFVLPRRLQAIARVGRTDLPLYGATALEHQRRGSRTTEAGGGLSAYLHGHDAKLQVDYTHLSSADATSAPTVHRIRAALQLAF